MRRRSQVARVPRVVACLVCLASLLPASPAAAADDGARAVELFEQGRKLMGNPATLDEACRVLAESLKLADRGDTLLNLADCHRRQGKTATSWGEFDKALGVGSKVGFGEAVAAATRFRDYLAARLSRLTVTVSPVTAALPEFKLFVNGQPWPQDRWSTPVPYDPGELEVTASAKGYKPFSAKVTLGPERDNKTIDIVLELVPPPAAPVPPPLPPPPPIVVVTPSRPIWPWIVGGLGVVLAGTAVGFEVDSRSAGSTLDTRCGPTRKACPVGFDFSSLRSRELRGYDVFLGLGIAGVVGIGAGALGLGLSGRSKTQTGFVFTPTSASFVTSF